MVLPTDYDLHLDIGAFNADGSFETPSIAVARPGRAVTESEAFWRPILLHTGPDRHPSPDGRFHVRFDGADGSHGAFHRMYNALRTEENMKHVLRKPLRRRQIMQPKRKRHRQRNHGLAVPRRLTNDFAKAAEAEGCRHLAEAMKSAN